MTEPDRPPLANRLLIADDEPGIRDALAFSLRQAGYAVELCADGLAAVAAFDRELPALVILDIMMPRLDGLAVLRHIRSLSQTLPVIFLTSRDEEFDKVLGLELGADDYMCKPFSLRELLARVRVLLRRSMPESFQARSEATGNTSVGSLELDEDCLIASWQGKPLRLTISEFRILSAMAKRPGVVFDRDMLIALAYPEERFVNDRAMDCHIKRIRQKLQGCAAPSALVETVYGAGYRFNQKAQ
jgi:DNA-binding response OmpR family regulator